MRWFLLFLPFCLLAKLPDLHPQDVQNYMQSILKEHAQHKTLDKTLMQRALVNYLEDLDPNKTYFIHADITPWLEPNDALLEKMLQDYNEGRFDTFAAIKDKLVSVIPRRRTIEKQIEEKPLPPPGKSTDLKDLPWANNEEELAQRLLRIRSLQIASSAKLNHEAKELTLQRVAKRQAKMEETLQDPAQSQRFVLTHALKALASSLDTHTNYFTPEEASQFVISVQQRLFGIGAQLRDDLNGFTIVKVVEGGPAAQSKAIKANDRIIAVDGEPVVGMEINEAVEKIRGEENSSVTLTIIRPITNDLGISQEEKYDITLKRGKVIIQESRYESAVEPYGDGAIGYLKLHSFYQDPEASSTQDLAEALEKLKKEQRLRGVILDLRYNSGGLLSQAVGVGGLFITKGVVASIKDASGQIQHLRDLDGKVFWDGPLIILTNRASASAAEIVAQSLQDYGRAIIVGDDHTYGKGSFQTFTLNGEASDVNPKGEYKVTRGRYYTVSGKTPQLVGVEADIVVPGALSASEVGEKYGKYPLENDQIQASFNDDLADIPFFQRDRVRLLYKFDLQPPLKTYQPYLETLRKNSAYRLAHNEEYKKFIDESKKSDIVDTEGETLNETFVYPDFQKQESLNIMKDLVALMHGF